MRREKQRPPWKSRNNNNNNKAKLFPLFWQQVNDDNESFAALSVCQMSSLAAKWDDRPKKMRPLSRNGHQSEAAGLESIGNVTASCLLFTWYRISSFSLLDSSVTSSWANQIGSRMNLIKMNNLHIYLNWRSRLRRTLQCEYLRMAMTSVTLMMTKPTTPHTIPAIMQMSARYSHQFTDPFAYFIDALSRKVITEHIATATIVLNRNFMRQSVAVNRIKCDGIMFWLLKTLTK